LNKNYSTTWYRCLKKSIYFKNPFFKKQIYV